MNTIREILNEANGDIQKILGHTNNKFLRSFMETAYLPEKKLDLPEGDPPYNVNKQEDHYTKGGFWQFARKIDVLYRKDISKLKIETLFIQGLEAVSAGDAKIILAAKDQVLHKEFPNLTLENLIKVGYFPNAGTP